MELDTDVGDGVIADGYVLRLARDEKCFVYLVLQQNWSNSSRVILRQLGYQPHHGSVRNG
jgi:hypothetical protein